MPKTRIVRLLIVSVACLSVAAQPKAAKPTVAVTTDDGLPGRARHGIDRLREAPRAQGFEAVDPSNASHADALVIAGLRSVGGAAAKTLKECGGTLRDGAEGLAVRLGKIRGKPAVVLCGADARGLTYAALDTAERLSWSRDPRNPFEFVRDTTERPFLAERGVSMYTMQRAYFESRLYDERYWSRYFDMLAASRINTIRRSR